MRRGLILTAAPLLTPHANALETHMETVDCTDALTPEFADLDAMKTHVGERHDALCASWPRRTGTFFVVPVDPSIVV